MKSQMKMIIASVVVIALALTAVSGVTYSWFSDSESSNITVTSGVVDLDSRLYEGMSVDEPVTGNLINDAITISGMIPGNTKYYQYYVTNNSTIDIKWRVYASFTVTAGNEQLATDLQVNNNNLALNPETGQYVSSMDFSDWAYTTPAETKIGTIAISLPEDSTAMGMTISGKIIIEGFQKNAAISVPELSYSVTGNQLTSAIPAVDSGAVVDSTELGIKLEFDSGTSSAISGKTLNIEKSSNPSSFTLNDGETPIAAYNMTLSDDTSALGGNVNVSITVDGTYSSPVVYYVKDDGTKIAMPIINIETSAGKTTITFVTNHFSNYVLGQKAEAIGVLGSETNTYATIDAAIDAGCTDITLLRNVQYNPEKYIRADGGNIAINLNGKTLNTKGIVANLGSTISVSNGTLIVSSLMQVANGSNLSIDNTIVKSNGDGFIVGFTSDTYTKVDTLKLTDVDMTVENNPCISAYKNSKLVIEGGSFTSGSGAIIIGNGTIGYGGQDWTVRNATFNVCENDTVYAAEMAAKEAGKGYNPISVGIQCHNNGTFLIENCTFNVENGIGVSVRGGDATINNCTFNLTQKEGRMTTGKIQYTDVSIDITIPKDIAVCYLSTGAYGYTASSKIIFNGSDVTDTIPVDGVAHYLNNPTPSES